MLFHAGVVLELICPVGCKCFLDDELISDRFLFFLLMLWLPLQKKPKAPFQIGFG